MKSKIALVRFPGSNCDMDMFDAFNRHLGINLEPIWHTESKLPKVDGVVLPGGFSYGDYLRSGALASHSPVMAAVKVFAQNGGPVLGICNGFQILTEAQLLPGALLHNSTRRFVCRQVKLAGADGQSMYHQNLVNFGSMTMPIAHGEGRYYIDDEGLKRLQGQGQVLLRYVGDTADSSQINPNGSLDDIAGIVSFNGRVMGMMPHPERATDEIMGGSRDGLTILKAFLSTTQS